MTSGIAGGDCSLMRMRLLSSSQMIAWLWVPWKCGRLNKVEECMSLSEHMEITMYVMTGQNRSEHLNACFDYEAKSGCSVSYHAIERFGISVKTDTSYNVHPNAVAV